jgi:hypothetical protein
MRDGAAEIGGMAEGFPLKANPPIRVDVTVPVFAL